MRRGATSVKSRRNPAKQNPVHSRLHSDVRVRGTLGVGDFSPDRSVLKETPVTGQLRAPSPSHRADQILWSERGTRGCWPSKDSGR